MPARGADTRWWRAALVERHTECGELSLVPPYPDAGDQPPARHAVERRHRFRGRDRIAVRHDQHRDADPNAARVRGDERHRTQRGIDVCPRGRAGIVADDDMVVDKDRIEADLPAFFAAAIMASGEAS